MVKSFFSRYNTFPQSLLFLSSLFLASLVYASGMFFPPTPGAFTPNGSFSIRFPHMFVSCPANEFLKGFDANLNRICVPSTGIYSGPSISQIPIPTSGTYPNAPAGQTTGGKFMNYFHNLSGLCSGNAIVKGFASDGWKYCVNQAAPDTILNPHTPPIIPNIGPITVPTGESTGGRFQDFFSTMVTNNCGSGEVVNGFTATGVQICGVACNANYTWNGAQCLPANKYFLKNITHEASGWGSVDKGWQFIADTASSYNQLTALISRGFYFDGSSNLYSAGQAQTECCSYSHWSYPNRYLCSANEIQNNTCNGKTIVFPSESLGGDDELVLQSATIDSNGYLVVQLRATSFSHGGPYYSSFYTIQ
ncbi:MAG: hypothetical protein PHH16_05060 [Candidatus Gracilibacteria bacterium]|nr:hypothetical protein [Candidatus Gracilibacteria bacterium]